MLSIQRLKIAMQTQSNVDARMLLGVGGGGGGGGSAGRSMQGKCQLATLSQLIVYTCSVAVATKL